MRRGAAALLCAAWLLAAKSGFAQGEEPSSWQPPPPSPDEFEWIRLTSGEWLKGEIDLLRDEELEFDSDELELLELDWEDVAELRSPRRNTYAFEDRILVTGTAWIRDSTVKIRTDDGEELEFERDALLAIIPGTPSERNYWSAKLSAGLTARAGNTDQADLTGKGFLRRETGFSRAQIDYSGAFGVLDDEENVNNHRGSAKLDLFVSRYFYVTPLTIDAFHDRFQNISYRITPGVGVGYQAIDRKKLEWDLELAVIYQQTRYISVEEDRDATTRTAALGAATRFDADITKRVELEGEYSLQAGVPDISDTNHHAFTTLSIEITDVFDLDVSFIWDRVESPERDADGNLPKKNDYRLTVGVGVEL